MKKKESLNDALLSEFGRQTSNDSMVKTLSTKVTSYEAEHNK